MTKSKKKVLFFFIYLIALINILVFIIYKITNNSTALFMSITLITTLTHIFIRFIFVKFILKFYKKNFDYKSNYFIERKIEKKLYNFLKVKKWKNKLPTWNEFSFDITSNTKKQLLNSMCGSEVYHLLCAILSFLTLLYAIFFNHFFIFFGTTLISSLFDLLFIIIQRYNRPRILKLISNKLK